MDSIRPPWEPQDPSTPSEPAPVLRVIPGRKPNGNNKHGKKLARRTLENLTPKMKERRDRFITEYVKDFNGPDAFIRAGGSATVAVKMASEYLREPYVSGQIWTFIDAMEEADLISRKRVIAMFIREANYQGMGASHGARVAAIGHLAKVLGMEQTNVNVKGDIKFKGGVMLVPAPDPMSWEQAAAEAQRQLKEDVRK
jgi:hypothetical protein